MRKLMGLTALMLLIANIGLLTKAEAKKEIATKNCPGVVKGLNFYKKATWTKQDKLNEKRFTSSYKPRKSSCKYTKWVANLWRARAEAKRSRLLYFSKVNRDWMIAVSYANRVFPGTSGWLKSCSRGEGGHGPWVWNKPVGAYGTYTLAKYPYKPAGSSGAGGWMQFLKSTFESNVDAAFASAKKRGYNIPDEYRSWYSAIGQAITAGYLRYSGQSFHWDPNIDYLCR